MYMKTWFNEWKQKSSGLYFNANMSFLAQFACLYLKIIHCDKIHKKNLVFCRFEIYSSLCDSWFQFTANSCVRKKCYPMQKRKSASYALHITDDQAVGPSPELSISTKAQRIGWHPFILAMTSSWQNCTCACKRFADDVISVEFVHV